VTLPKQERKRYKFHVSKCNGEFSHVSSFDEYGVTKNINLTPADRSIDFKLIDLHVDFNPVENAKNRSNLSYKIYVPWLRSLGYRVFAKNIAFAATSAADLLLKD
jgi:predicted RNase H-related nuclease YkuK (DUF458 family)